MRAIPKQRWDARGQSTKGIPALFSNGCNDAPLLQVASISLELVFVHVADDSEPLVAVDKDDGNDDASVTSEEEWHDDDLIRALPLPLRRSLKEGSPSSDEEIEFE